MGRFATNKNGNIDSGTEVLANNMTFLQQTKEESISNLFGDLFDEGILSGFELTANVDGTFNVGIGIGYKKDVNSNLYNRIAILEETDYHNELFGDSTYPDGRGINQKTNTGIEDEYVDTPKSTGCLNIPIPVNEVTYYIDLRYLNVCDNGNNGDGLSLTNYSIAKNIVSSNDKRKRFYKWIDGYNIELVATQSEIQGICLGTVQKATNNTITFTETKRANELLIKSKIIMDYFTDGSGITIIEEGGKRKLAINVDDITTEIENNKIRVTKDGLYPYTKFTVNSGNTDSNNEPNILDTNGTDIYFNFGAGTPLVVSPAYNDKYTIYSNSAIEIIDDAGLAIQSYYGETADGTYTICINDTDKDNNNEKLDYFKLEIMKNIFISQSQPLSQKGNIWLDTSIEPFKAKWYNGSSWVEYHGVPLGEAEISNVTISSVSSYTFNKQIEYNLQTKSLYLYNYNTSATKKSIECHLSDNGLFSLNSTGISFSDPTYIGALSVYDNLLDIVSFNDLLFHGNPIPRLPDYSALIQLYGQDSDPQTKTIPNDGWLLIRTMAANAYIGINSHIIIDDSWSVAVQEEVMLPIKAGDIINFRNTIVYFCPYR